MRMVRAVDTLINRTLSTVGTSPRSGPLSPAEQAEILGTDWSPQYVAEAQERWGDTPEWAEATARQAAMTREDWEQVKARTLALEADLVAAMARGVEPGSQEANALAERHRADLGQWFTVTYPKQVLIARGYTADPRFAAHYDRQAPGLAPAQGGATQQGRDQPSAASLRPGAPPGAAVLPGRPGGGRRSTRPRPQCPGAPAGSRARRPGAAARRGYVGRTHSYSYLIPRST